MVQENFTVFLYTPQQYFRSTGQELEKISDNVQIKSSLVRSFAHENPPFPEFIKGIEQCRRQQRYHTLQLPREIGVVDDPNYKAFHVRMLDEHPHIVTVSHEDSLIEKVRMLPGRYYFIGSHNEESDQLTPYAILALSSEG